MCGPRDERRGEDERNAAGHFLANNSILNNTNLRQLTLRDTKIAGPPLETLVTAQKPTPKTLPTNAAASLKLSSQLCFVIYSAA